MEHQKGCDIRNVISSEPVMKHLESCDIKSSILSQSGIKHLEGCDIQNKLVGVRSLAEIVEVEIEVVSPSIVPSGSFAELKSHCHLYGAQGQRQAYLLPMPR
ncbi:hypothetical protein TNCV_904791 [Trichonephila clavipes]|nr:hypothetical protein TNCV_904791 [Trichonephila clavipes]